MKIEESMLQATEWVKQGGMMVRRSALDDNHPDSWPSLWRKQFNEEMPNDKRAEVGVGPAVKLCPHCGRPIED